jgi:hypothetical protein
MQRNAFTLGSPNSRPITCRAMLLNAIERLRIKQNQSQNQSQSQSQNQNQNLLSKNSEMNIEDETLNKHPDENVEIRNPFVTFYPSLKV